MTTDLMISFAWISAMMLIGVLLRGIVPIFRRSLVPASVLGGTVGLILVSIPAINNILQIDTSAFGSIIFQLFIIVYGAVGLMGLGTKNASKEKVTNVARYALWLSLIWIFLYFGQMVLGTIFVWVTNSIVGTDMPVIFGYLLAMGFAQGPGQAVTWGTIFDSVGISGGVAVGMTFAAIGFMWAFLVGVPMAKIGIKKGLAKHCGEIDYEMMRGFYAKENQKLSTGTHTFHGGNIETFAFHIALIMLCYLLGWKFVQFSQPYLPGTWPQVFAGMMFVWVFLFAMLVRLLIKKAGYVHLINADVTRTVTSLGVEFFILATIMGIQFSIVGQWLAPILITALSGGIFTFVCLFYLGARIGGDGDFERTMEMWGHATGTVPSGIALLRIVDPEFKTTTIMEVGLMNPILVPTTIWLNILITAPFTLGWSIEFTTGIIGVAALVALALIKIFKLWGKPTYSLFGK